MPQTWIGPNRRALLLGFFLPGMLLVLGVAAGVMAIRTGTFWYAAPGVALGALGLVAALVLARLIRQPRVAFKEDCLLVYFGTADPFRIPIEAIECFFIGQAGGMIPNASGKEAEVRTVIIRLAESAKDWHHRDVKPALGHWCEGYITIRGTWCEPITPALMARLNRQLSAALREQAARRVETSS